MHGYIHQYIKGCDTCRCAKPSNENTQAPIGKFRDPTATGQMLSIDLVGPWPVSKYGYKYIFVVIDCFSKYVWTKPLRRMTTQSVTDFLVESVFPNNGCPRIILSDNGTQFTSSIFSNMCNRMGIKHWRTPKYHPQANPVEATNKSIKYAMRTYLTKSENHSGWSCHLSKIIADINSTPHTTTNRSPQYIHFGRELVKHASEYDTLVSANPSRENDIDYQQLVNEEVRDRATDRYDTRREKSIRATKARVFKEGAIVRVPLLKLSNKATKYNQKLAPKSVQVRVTKRVGTDVYLISDLKGKDLDKVHSSDIFTQ